MISDSLIIGTNGTDPEALENLLSFTQIICRREFSVNNIALRGAIAKGQFEMLEERHQGSLSLRLLLGQAYVDAYLMEGSLKTFGIILTNEVAEDMNEINDISGFTTYEESNNKEVVTVLSYIDRNFFEDSHNLEVFVRLAVDAKWLPHYYNTLYYSCMKEAIGKSYTDGLFKRILAVIAGLSQANSKNIDTFITKIFSEGVNEKFKNRFLSFIKRQMSV